MSRKKKSTWLEPPDPQIDSLAEQYRAYAEEHQRILHQQMLTQSSWGRLLGGLEPVEQKPKPPSVDRIKLELLKTAEPYKVTARIPDYVQVITAWRAWDLKSTPEGWRLEALGKSVIWNPKQAIEATCVKGLGIVRQLNVPEMVKPEHPAPQS